MTRCGAAAADKRSFWTDDDPGIQLERVQEELDQLKERLLAPRPREIGGAPARAVTAQLVRDMLRARRRRESLFGNDLFADPAWDMLLELYAADLAQRKISVSGLCGGAAVPATTALRWISKLERDGLLSRVDDPLDGRRTWVRLSGRGISLMQKFFETCTVWPL